jgi:hypothetical protein
MTHGSESKSQSNNETKHQCNQIQDFLQHNPEHTLLWSGRNKKYNNQERERERESLFDWPLTILKYLYTYLYIKAQISWPSPLITSHHTSSLPRRKAVSTEYLEKWHPTSSIPIRLRLYSPTRVPDLDIKELWIQPGKGALVRIIVENSPGRRRTPNDVVPRQANVMQPSPLGIRNNARPQRRAVFFASQIIPIEHIDRPCTAEWPDPARPSHTPATASETRPNGIIPIRSQPPRAVWNIASTASRKIRSAPVLLRECCMFPAAWGMDFSGAPSTMKRYFT